MQPWPRRATLTLIVIFAGSLAALGQQKDEPKSADLQVWSIRATTKNKDISPELRDLADKLKKQFKFTGFKLEKRDSGKTDFGKTFTQTLIGGYEARVTPQKRDDKRITLQIEVVKGKDRQLNTTITLDAGKFQLWGGWSLEGGDALIVAVSAK